jgi:hypothetical protein
VAAFEGAFIAQEHFRNCFTDEHVHFPEVVEQVADVVEVGLVSLC